MFNVGDIIIYTTTGLCRIDSLIKKEFNGQIKDYYILKPLNDNRSVLQVQVDNPITQIKLKTLLSKDEIMETIAKLPVLEPYWIENENERKKTFSEILRNGERLEILKLIKSILEHHKGLKEKGRKLHACDEQYLKDGKKLIAEEFSYVLNMDRPSFEEYIKNIMGPEEE